MARIHHIKKTTKKKEKKTERKMEDRKIAEKISISVVQNTLICIHS